MATLRREIIMFTFLAQQSKPLGTLGGEDLGPFGIGATEDIGSRFAGAISSIIGFLTIVAGLFFIFQFIIGAIQWLASGGDKAGLQASRDKITNSLIGLILMVAAIAIISLLGEFLGFKILDPASFIEAIKFK